MSHHVPSLKPKNSPIGIGDSAVFTLSLKTAENHSDDFTVNFSGTGVSISRTSQNATVPAGGSVDVSTDVSAMSGRTGYVTASVSGASSMVTARVDVNGVQQQS
ncbi:MAG: hypothetical protein H0W86_11220 [Armatimonadetes bacterium]|nr:hypothetical protein [Armatimonadota bacterium]